jgi:GxxExxY protein
MQCKVPPAGLIHAATTGPLLDAFFQVYRELGYGFLERVYANALAIVARDLGLEIRQQVPIRVHYKGILVGEYTADLVANGLVLVELKAAKALADEHQAQLLNYLRATPYEVGLLLNFGPKAQYKRTVFNNSRKGNRTCYSSIVIRKSSFVTWSACIGVFPWPGDFLK